MRNITVDFTNKPPIISDRYGGELGEHQATMLKITPETEMTQDENIAYYYVVFAVDGGIAMSRTFTTEEDIEVELWSQLTAKRSLKFQLIASNGETTIIAKSPVVSLYIGDSIKGEVVDEDGNHDSLFAMLNAMKESVDFLDSAVPPTEMLDPEDNTKTLYSGKDISTMYINGMNCRFSDAPIIARWGRHYLALREIPYFPSRNIWYITKYEINRNDPVVDSIENYQLLPMVTSEDSGKGLIVDEQGVWVASANTNIQTTTSLNQYSTDDEVPTAKTVYDYVTDLVGDVNTAITAINSLIGI